MSVRAHTNPSRHPDDIDRPTPAPAEIDRTTPRPDETDTQREHEDAPANPDPDSPTAPARERGASQHPGNHPRAL